MFLSVFDLFKIGVGPSSSHTMGPMIAARRFASTHIDGEARPIRIKVILHGSLAFTGKGHATDAAIIAGLSGQLPETYDASRASEVLQRLREEGQLICCDGKERPFDPDKDIVFDRKSPLEGHANGMVFVVCDLSDAEIGREVWYSIGGGFVLTESELENEKSKEASGSVEVPYPFETAAEMLSMAGASGKSIAQIKLENELSSLSLQDIEAGLTKVWQVMSSCIERGLSRNGALPGGLNLERRAQNLARDQAGGVPNNLSTPLLDKVAAYAIAVNEENAAGGQVVTAPTNGAAGIVPAVLKYALDQLDPRKPEPIVHEYLLTAAAIGGIIKHNASISGAECGCQAEVGSASAMAAAGLAAISGGTAAQIENAAEIALEHHLGMTCDPVLGLVQVPCIERNAMGSIKAITASSLALRGDGRHFMPLDACIETMRQTGVDMHERYKETSLGGLAVNFPNC
jgi:L-serine dehydratase